jgi:hypothetical protein
MSPGEKLTMGNAFKDWNMDKVNAHNARVAAGKSIEELNAAQPVQALKLKVPREQPPPGPFRNAKAGWCEFGERRIYLRSNWERNYAYYLHWLKQHGTIKEWEYEPDTFWFDGIQRGCMSYKPDFKVTHPDGSVDYHEVKGWLDSKSKTKLRRMKKYHPEIVVRLRDRAWFQANRDVLGIASAAA